MKTDNFYDMNCAFMGGMILMALIQCLFFPLSNASRKQFEKEAIQHKCAIYVVNPTNGVVTFKWNE